MEPENSFHKWSVVLQRLGSEAGAWQAFQTQVTQENDIYVYYDAPVPGFSLFAITGAAEPVVLEYTVADLQITPAVAEDGATVTITASVTNTGAEDQSIPLNMSVNSQVDDSKSVSVAAGATETVTFTTVQTLGSYEVQVDRLYGNFTVAAPQVATPTPEPTVVPPQPTAITAPAPTAPAATATSAPAPAPTAVATIEPAEDDDGGNNGLIIDIIIVVVLIGGGIAFFAIRSRRRI